MRVDRIGTSIALALFALIAPVSTAAQPPDDDLLPARPTPFLIVPLVQEPQVIAVSDEQIQEVEQWARDFEAWQAWAERYLNRRQQGFWNNYVERSRKPAPPEWLAEACPLLGGDERLSKPCALLVTWREDPLVTKERRSSAAALKQKENPTNSVWWQHIHVDGLWSTTQSNMTAIGLFGAHVTIDVAGRLQTFLTPGILLVSVPSLFGSREVSPATDWGISYRLFNVGRSSVHFNLVHAWLFDNRANLVHANMTLAGFSVSFRRDDAGR